MCGCKPRHVPGWGLAEVTLCANNIKRDTSIANYFLTFYSTHERMIRFKTICHRNRFLAKEPPERFVKLFVALNAANET